MAFTDLHEGILAEFADASRVELRPSAIDERWEDGGGVIYFRRTGLTTTEIGQKAARAAHASVAERAEASGIVFDEAVTKMRLGHLSREHARRVLMFNFPSHKISHWRVFDRDFIEAYLAAGLPTPPPYRPHVGPKLSTEVASARGRLGGTVGQKRTRAAVRRLGMTTDEVAEHLGVTKTHVNNVLYRRIPSAKVKGRRVFRREDVEAYAEGRPAKGRRRWGRMPGRTS